MERGLLAGGTAGVRLSHGGFRAGLAQRGPTLKGTNGPSDPEDWTGEVCAMQDGKTRQMRAVGSSPARAFLTCMRAALVQLSGEAAGSEFELDRERLVAGRGSEADLSFEDAAMSREHAAFECGAEGFSVIDLGSTNGVLVNDASVGQSALKHGDRVQLGDHVFQYVIEEKSRSPKTFSVC